jgi:hypothetical protein
MSFLLISSVSKLSRWNIKLLSVVFIITITSIIGLTNHFVFKKHLITSRHREEIQLEVNSNEKKFIPVPCIEPYCQIECMMLYPSYKIGKINRPNMSEEEKRHILIDIGRDEIVNDMINNYPPAKVCSYNTSNIISKTQLKNVTVEYFPLSFGFGEHYLLKTIRKKVLFDSRVISVEQMCIPKKSKDFSDLIPGRPETYQFSFGEELEYRRMYSSVYFAVTMKKGGWDCNRHYEILSAGTVPYFDELECAGLLTMVHLPKTLLLEAHSMTGINRPNLAIDHSRFNLTQYRLLLHRILYYTKHRLTTRKLVEYILKTIQYPMSHKNHSVLFLSHGVPDYMKEFMLHGFTLIFGSSLHVANPPKYLYVYPHDKKWTVNNTKEFYSEKLYGFGYAYALSLTKYAKLYERDIKELSHDAVIIKNIKNRQCTLVVFGSILRRNHLFPIVTRYYNKSRIVVIDGEDESKRSERPQYARLATYFLREIPDRCDDFS